MMTYSKFNLASTLVAAEHTTPCTNRIARRIPKVGPFPRFTEPSEPTAMAVVIICALYKGIKIGTRIGNETSQYLDRIAHQVKSMEQTKVTCPVTLAHPVIQLASSDHCGGASLAEK